MPIRLLYTKKADGAVERGFFGTTLNKRSKYTVYDSKCITYHLHIIYTLRNRRYTRAFNVTLKKIFRNK